jgi:hypothetical protein
MTEFHYRCPLGRRVIERTDPETLKAQGWHKQGILAISPEDSRLNWMEREVLTQIAERLYGRRSVRHG